MSDIFECIPEKRWEIDMYQLSKEYYEILKFKFDVIYTETRGLGNNICQVHTFNSEVALPHVFEKLNYCFIPGIYIRYYNRANHLTFYVLVAKTCEVYVIIAKDYHKEIVKVKSVKEIVKFVIQKKL